MPSFCPKLESFTKVMHRRKAKNDQKFTKFCFSQDLSLKSGKINFHEFWIIFGHSTVHHLKKTPKITPKFDLEKKTFLQKSQKTQNFYFRRAINLPNMLKKSKFFCQTTSHTPKRTEKNFYRHRNNIREMNLRFLKKTRFYRNQDEVEILAE